jgi:hypothetical protein
VARRYATVRARCQFDVLIADHSFSSLIDILIGRREQNAAFKLDNDREGWLLRRNADGHWRRMCWLPYKRRHEGTICACFGQKVVIGAKGGLFSNI